jgi:hypothetical protein
MRKIFIRIGQIFKRNFVDGEANESARKPWLSDEEAPGKMEAQKRKWSGFLSRSRSSSFEMTARRSLDRDKLNEAS